MNVSAHELNCIISNGKKNKQETFFRFLINKRTFYFHQKNPLEHLDLQK
jgi:hypothetical protein